MPHLSVPPLQRGKQKLSCIGTSIGAVYPSVIDDKLQSLRTWPIFPFPSNRNRLSAHSWSLMLLMHKLVKLVC